MSHEPSATEFDRLLAKLNIGGVVWLNDNDVVRMRAHTIKEELVAAVRAASCHLPGNLPGIYTSREHGTLYIAWLPDGFSKITVDVGWWSTAHGGPECPLVRIHGMHGRYTKLSGVRGA